MRQLFQAISELDIFSPPKQYISNVLEILCQEFDYEFGSVIKLDEFGQGVMIGSYNLPPNYIETVNKAAPILHSPSGEAINKGRIVVVKDIPADSRLSPWYELIKLYNYQTMVWIPLLNQGKGFGSLNLYDAKGRTIIETELEALQQVGILLSNAIASNNYLDKLNAKTEELYDQIKERQIAEEALVLREQNFKALIENSPNIIARFDKQMRCVYINPAGEKALGILAEQFIGKTNKALDMPVDVCATFEKHIDDVFQIGKGQSIEFQYSHLGGTKYYQYRLIPELGEDGWPKFVITIGNDITEYTIMKEEQLKASKLESIGILAGGIAHDFNNILTAILGNVCLAKINANKSKDTITKRLEEIEAACLQAKDLTQQLLTFSKGGKPVRKPRLISEFLEEWVNFTLRGSNIKCEFVIEPGLYPVEVDTGQINQVINNLIINAKQAMPNGGVIRVLANNSRSSEIQPIPLPDKGTDYVKIAIQDEGVGIPEDCLSKIFDPYFTTKQTGSGLGLTTTYSIIQKHNGYITVESELGQGSTFHIYLPAYRQKLPLESPKISDVIQGKGKVLVMDDEKLIREVACQMLNSLGYAASGASDGVEAIQLYEKAKALGEPFDLLIMDLTIPGGMGGREAIQRLLGLNPDLKAIVSSGYSNDPILASFEHYGFIGVLEKPYTIRELSRVLQKAIGH